MENTARLWLIPSSRSLWCKWSRSAEEAGLPDSFRRTIAKTISEMGTISVRIGAKTDIATADFTSP